MKVRLSSITLELESIVKRGRVLLLNSIFIYLGFAPFGDE